MNNEIPNVPILAFFDDERKIERITSLQNKIMRLNERLSFDPHNSDDQEALNEFNIELNRLQGKKKECHVTN
jgi:hypothetical protein